MHLLENYALSTASKIKKSYINKKFFPIPAEKYITVSTASEIQNGNYDYFQDVIDFIFPKLEQSGYKIIQVGSKDDKPLSKVINLQGVTNINQLAFVLNNSQLHIGNDSFMIHMCSSFDIPVIGLYSISSPNVTGPFWKSSKQICLTPPINNWQPSFNPNENPKTINKIKIEKIVGSINSLLFNENDINFNTVYYGERYGNILLEALPDQILPPEFFQNILLNIRFDYINKIEDKDYNGILNNLNIRPCSIITDKTINLQPLLQFKDRINLLFYDVTNSIDLDFTEALHRFGIRHAYIFHENKGNKEDIAKRKFDLIEYPNNLEIISSKIPKIENIKSCFYKSNKLLLANQNAYLSRAAQLENKPIHDLSQPWVQQCGIFNDINTFLSEDIEYSLIFK
jgi:hypothetical protein